MKKLVFALAALFATMMISCVSDGQTDQQDGDLTDSIEQEMIDTVTTVTGVAIDGAMNSIYLKVGDDTIGFSYPDLDMDHRAPWDMGDTVTVRYYVTESGDSVTDIIIGDLS